MVIFNVIYTINMKKKLTGCLADVEYFEINCYQFLTSCLQNFGFQKLYLKISGGFMARHLLTFIIICIDIFEFALKLICA